MSAERRVKAFFTLAERGLVSASLLLRAGQLEDAALFLQQVVERIARALLTHSGVAFGTSHNIGQMADALPAAHLLRDRIRAFDDLSSAVTAFRYPTSSGRLQQPPAVDKLREKLTAAERLLIDARAHVYEAKA